jgi:phosphoglucosamine mutase
VRCEGITLSALEEALNNLHPDTITKLDGIKVKFPDGWILVRASGTEPKIRLTAEAKTEARLNEYYEAALAAVKKSAITGGIPS